MRGIVSIENGNRRGRVLHDLRSELLPESHTGSRSALRRIVLRSTSIYLFRSKEGSRDSKKIKLAKGSVVVIRIN